MILHWVPILFICLANSVFGQASYFQSAPAIGWDSLQSLMQVPEIYRLAGLEQSVTVSLVVDSTGEAHIGKIVGGEEFAREVRRAISQTKWTRRQHGPNTFEEVLTLQFLFRTKHPDISKTLIIEAVPRRR